MFVYLPDFLTRACSPWLGKHSAWDFGVAQEMFNDQLIWPIKRTYLLASNFKWALTLSNSFMHSLFALLRKPRFQRFSTVPIPPATLALHKLSSIAPLFPLPPPNLSHSSYIFLSSCLKRMFLLVSKPVPQSELWVIGILSGILPCQIPPSLCVPAVSFSLLILFL